MSLRGETAFAPPSGPVVQFEYIFAPVLNDDGNVEAVAGSARDITERKAIEHVNWQTENYDVLTGLPNRRLFHDRLAQDLMHTGRVSVLLALLFIDLERFKEANDRFGHDAGDILLRLVADRLRSCVRKTDTVARLGGDEFTVILNGVADSEHAGMIAEKILKKLARVFHILKNTLHISASIGTALAPQHVFAPEQLIKNADKAMYMAKKLGRNRCNLFSVDKNKEQSERARLRLIEDLHDALEQHRLSIYYQPIFDLQSGRPIKAEALLRWDHPKIGLMLQAQFIRLAEDAALVDAFDEIGNWVFAEAALRSREWSLLSGASFQIGINLSARQFTDHCNCMSWGAYIKTLGLAAHCVSIDIREDALLKGTIDVNERINQRHCRTLH